MAKSSFIKTDEEIEIMKKSGNICAKALKEVLKNIKPGVSCLSLDLIAKTEIEEQGASSAFMTVDDYKHTICTTINEQVVHAIPTGRKLENGDIIGIDIGALYKGYHSDLAITVPVGKVSKSTRKFMEVGRETLKSAIARVKVGSHIGDISQTIQDRVEKASYSVVRSLTGHGVGKQLHEEPMVPCFGENGKGLTLVENMTLAIEVIYTSGNGKVGVLEDGWTISSVDGSLGGLFEQTIAVKKTGPIVLTPYL